MYNQTFNSYYLEMFDTLKLIYTQDEALELVSRYEKAYKEKIAELEEENRRLSEKNKIYSNALVQEKEENRKLKLHIEAKDKAYTALLKDYEETKQDSDKMKKLEKELSAAYKAYHTALGVDYVSEEDLYDLDD